MHIVNPTAWERHTQRFHVEFLMALVATVRGPVEPKILGRTLAHEHVINVTDWIARDFPDESWDGDRARVIAYVSRRLPRSEDRRASTRLSTAPRSGTVATWRRSPKQTQSVDLNIVVSTGIYTYNALPLFFKYRPPHRRNDGALQDILVDFFVRDIREGIQGTAIKAAVIKCATDADGRDAEH